MSGKLLTDVARAFSLGVSSKREETIQNILSFLMKPNESYLRTSGICNNYYALKQYFMLRKVIKCMKSDNHFPYLVFILFIYEKVGSGFFKAGK